MASRRIGDVGTLVCDGALATKELKWKPIRDLDVMCEYFNFKGLNKRIPILQPQVTFIWGSSTITFFFSNNVFMDFLSY